MNRNTLTRLALAAALLVPMAAVAEPALLPSHAVQSIVMESLGDNIPVAIQALAYGATTTGQFTVGPKNAVVNCPSSDTCSAPTLVTQFVDVTNWTGFTITVEAESGKTLTGVGNIDCYSWDPNTYNAVSYQQLSSDLTVTKSGQRRVTLPGVWFPAARGKLTCVPTGVITSATGGVKLFIDGWTNKAN